MSDMNLVNDSAMAAMQESQKLANASPAMKKGVAQVVVASARAKEQDVKAKEDAAKGKAGEKCTFTLVTSIQAAAAIAFVAIAASPDADISLGTLRVLLLLSCLFLHRIYTINFLKAHKLPPGPVGLPLLGSTLALGWDLRNFYRDTMMKYDDIASYRIGSDNLIVINDIPLAKQIYMGSNAIGYHIARYIHLKNKEMQRVHSIFHQGDEWMEVKKPVARIVKTLADSKLLENQLREAYLTQGVKYIDNQQDKTARFNIRPFCKVALFRLATLAFLNKEVDVEHEFFHLFSGPGHEYIMGLMPGHMFGFFFKDSWLSQQFMQWFMLRHHDTVYKGVDDFVTPDALEFLKKKYDPEDKYTRQELCTIVLGIFSGVIDTTAIMLEWCLLILANHADIQEELRNELAGKELDEIIFNDPTQHRCRAFVFEVFRVYPIGLASLYRTLTNETHVTTSSGNEYVLPKGQAVHINIDGIHRYSKSGKDSFDHRQWLDDDGKFQPRYLMASEMAVFSFGARECPGKAIALRELQFMISLVLTDYVISDSNNKDQSWIYRTMLKP